MEALYSPHQDGFALPQWNNASCEKPLILPAYFGALSLHKYNPLPPAFSQTTRGRNNIAAGRHQ